jgi:derlin-1
MSTTGSEFSDWYKAIPQMTRYWFTGSVILPLAARFGLLNPQYLVLFFEPFFQKFQVKINKSIISRHTATL